MDTQSIPRFWREKLLALNIGGSEPVDVASSVYTAIRVNFTESENPDLQTREFSIRTDPVTKEQFVWRTK